MAIRSRFLRTAVNPADNEPPSVPVGTQTFANQTTIGVSWGVSTDNRSTSGYEVEFNGVIESGTFSQEAGFTKSDLTPGTSYNVRVRAFDNSGNRSGWSSNISANTEAAGGGGGGGPAWAPNFPALAAYYIGESEWSNSANDSKLAPCACVVYNYFYASGDLPSRMAATRSLTPAGVGVVPSHQIYVVQNESYPASASWYTEYRNKLNTENWWLRTTYPAGSIVLAAFGSGVEEINNTSGAFADVDGGGKDWITWHCDVIKIQNVTGGVPPWGGASLRANNYIDANYCDNIFWKKRVNGDFDRDGTTDSRDDTDFITAVRAGYEKYADYMRTILPTQPVIGNMDFYLSQGAPLYNSSYTPDYTAIGVLHQLFDGGLGHEYLLDNSSNSFEWDERNNGLNGLYATRNAMRFMHNTVLEPHRLMFSVRDVTFDNSAADNQRLRFGIAMVCCFSNGMIDDSGWSRTPSSTQHAYYTNNGAGHGWLGQPISETPNWTPDGQGVYIREFDNGYVALNPRNNGSRTFTIPVDVKNIATNVTYSANSTIPIADRDGALLLKV